MAKFSILAPSDFLTLKDFRSDDYIWFWVIILSSALAIAVNISVLITGYDLPAEVLFYIPIWIAAAKFAWYGIMFSFVLAALYLAPFPFYQNPYSVWIGALLKAGVMVANATIVAWLSLQIIRIKTDYFNSSRLMKRIADYAYNWEYWVDHEGTVLYMSPAVTRITGYTPEQFRRNPDLFEQIIHPLDQKSWEIHKKHAHEHEPTRREVETEFRILTKNGETRWIGHVCRRLYNEYNQFQGMRVSNRDITAQVEAEEKLLEISMESEKKERDFYSREIHDRLGPLLSTIKLYFQWLSDTNDITKTKLITEKGNKSIDAAIETLREISHNLSSHNIDRYGFTIAMKQMAEQINASQQIKLLMSANSSERFEKKKEVALYYCTSELINNTIKHAYANNITINFAINESTQLITLHYQDDGKGFNLEILNEKPVISHGLGLLNIQQRIKALRGKFDMHSFPGRGFRAEIELPL